MRQSGVSRSCADHVACAEKAGVLKRTMEGALAVPEARVRRARDIEERRQARHDSVKAREVKHEPLRGDVAAAVFPVVVDWRRRWVNGAQSRETAAWAHQGAQEPRVAFLSTPHL